MQIIWGGLWKASWEPLAQLNALSRQYFEKKFGKLPSVISSALADKQPESKASSPAVVKTSEAKSHSVPMIAKVLDASLVRAAISLLPLPAQTVISSPAPTQV